jgi:hypothetical protein
MLSCREDRLKTRVAPPRHGIDRGVRALFVLLSIGSLSAIGFPQALTVSPKSPLPESAFVSPHRYTNAFFGFTLILPKAGHFQLEDLSASDKALQHFLYAEKSMDKGVTLLLISATQVLGNAPDEAQKAAFIPNSHDGNPAEALSIGSRLFWKSDIEVKTFAGKLRRLRYTTGVPGFVLQFSVSSYNAKLAEELRENIESMKFFDPAQARTIAGPDSRPFLPVAAQLRLKSEPQVRIEQVNEGEIANNVYTNAFLGFSYYLPDGWYVEKPSEEQIASIGRPTLPAAAKAPESMDTASDCTRVLLAATKNAPEEHEDNSRITVVVADPACFVPDMKFPDSVHDQQGLEFFGGALIRALAGTPLLGQGANTVRAVDLAGHLFIEIPSATTTPVKGSALLRKIHRSLILTSVRGYWLIWLFESSAESELRQLMKTAISFQPPG